LIPQLAPAELAAWRADPARTAPVVIDVREPWEYALCHIDDSLHLPLGELAARLAEVPRDRDLVLVCHHGSRSQHAALLLARNGFDGVHNLRGGIEAWALDVDPAVSRY
jgi:rhodanese-related sulfurtransferase